MQRHYMPLYLILILSVIAAIRLAEADTHSELSNIFILDTRDEEPISPAPSALSNIFTLDTREAQPEDTSSFKLELAAGINLISVPLRPEREWKLSDLLNAIGPKATVIIAYDKTAKKFVTYMPNFPQTSPANAVVKGDEGYIVVMSAPGSVTFTGEAWDGTVSLATGINVISIPKNPGVAWRLSDLIELIGKDATMVISYDNISQKFATHMPDLPVTAPTNTLVEGGKAYIVMMEAPASVTVTGTAWSNAITPSPRLIASTLGIKATPFFVIEGFISRKEDGMALNNVEVTVRNLNNSVSTSDLTGAIGDDGQYIVTLADLETNRAVQVGDVIQIIAQEPTRAFCEGSMRYTIKANDIQHGKVSLDNLTLFPFPKKSALLQNYPNPFNPDTWIPYQLAQAAEVTISIYDAAGRRVCFIHLGVKPAGIYFTKDKAGYWNGRNDVGEKVASGLYFYQLRAGDLEAARKMIIVK